MGTASLVTICVFFWKGREGEVDEASVPMTAAPVKTRQFNDKALVVPEGIIEGPPAQERTAAIAGRSV